MNIENLDILRKGDKIKFECGEEAEVNAIVFKPDDGLFYIDFGNGTAFRYNAEGKCEFPSYDIKEVELVELETDKITYYVPYVYWAPSPVVSINIKGAKKPVKQMVVKSLFEIDGVGPFYKGEIIKADVLPVVYAELRKCKGRDMTVLKTEKIFCTDEKEAKDTVANFKDKYLQLAEDNSDGKSDCEVKEI